MAYTTRTITAVQRQPNGRLSIQVKFTGSGESDVTREENVRSKAEAETWAKGILDELNGAKTAETDPAMQVGQVLGDPSAAADPAGQLRTWITVMRDIARREDFRAKLALRALTNPPANAQQLTGWNALLADLATKIDALKIQAAIAYGQVNNTQKQAGIDNL